MKRRACRGATAFGYHATPGGLLRALWLSARLSAFSTLTATLMLGVFLWASQSVAQTGGSAGGTGGGDRPGARIPIHFPQPSFALPCREGEQLLLPDEMGQPHFEVRTCTDGRFYPRRAPLQIGPICEDGVTYLVPGQQEGSGYEFRTCRDGRLFPRQKGGQPRSTRCIEGERFLSPDPRSRFSDSSQLVEVECRNGKLFVTDRAT
jgi:hypothetical protein